jgi:sporulation protein YlmC with PRC-barrel domain
MTVILSANQYRIFLLFRLLTMRGDPNMNNYETRDTYGIYKTGHNNGSGPRLMGADTLIGNEVCNLENEGIGDIKEIMLDVSSGNIEYAVLSFGSFLGMGEKLFAVPWSALKLDTENKRFLLNINKETLKNAPGFNKDDWPNLADKSLANDLHSYYGTKPNTNSMRN